MSLIALLFAAALSGETPTVSPVEVKPAVEEEMICRRIRDTGSNRTERVCRPKSVVEAEKAERSRNVRLGPATSGQDRIFQGSPRPPPGRAID